MRQITALSLFILIAPVAMANSVTERDYRDFRDLAQRLTLFQGRNLTEQRAALPNDFLRECLRQIGDASETGSAVADRYATYAFFSSQMVNETDEKIINTDATAGLAASRKMLTNAGEALGSIYRNCDEYPLAVMGANELLEMLDELAPMLESLQSKVGSNVLPRRPPQ